MVKWELRGKMSEHRDSLESASPLSDVPWL